MKWQQLTTLVIVRIKQVFARRWGYLLACIIMGTGYWLTI